MKGAAIQDDSVRRPRQARSRYKVQLILEATVRLLEKGGLDALTTNAVAAAAGVSIGTLYQFFGNKEAILEALADHETAEMRRRVVEVMQDSSIVSTESRIGAIVGAVAASYGDRRRAHRIVMAHSLARGGKRLSPLLAQLTVHLSSERQAGAIRKALGRADAFVLTHAFAGVLRAMTSEGEAAPPKGELEQALTRLVANFIG